jgi:hypothetical protein
MVKPNNTPKSVVLLAAVLLLAASPAAIAAALMAASPSAAQDLYGHERGMWVPFYTAPVAPLPEIAAPSPDQWSHGGPLYVQPNYGSGVTCQFCVPNRR